MATFSISRVTALPGTLAANTVYIVSTGLDKAEIYVTGNTATARRILNQADIQSLIDASVQSISSIRVVDNIAQRDALGLTQNAQVFVIDATGDATVSSGGATYIYRAATSTFIKVSESESLDLALQWTNIVGRPSSTPSQIDAAVAASHSHTNKTQLDQIGQSASGDITYGGREYVRSGSSDW